MITDTEARLLALIQDRQSEIVEYLQQLLRFKTVTPLEGSRAEGEDYKQHQQLISDTLKEMGADILETWEVDAAQLEQFPGSGVIPKRDLSGMPVVVGTFKGSGGGKSLILNGHYDVVPIGMRNNWNFDPYGGEILKGRMYGRGTCDMKGGLASMIQALKLIRQVGIKLKGDVIVQVVPDEEMTCMGTLSCCQRGYKADAALIPEPTDMGVLTAMRGSIYGTIKVRGRAGHAEMAQPHWTEGGAVNAISKSALIIQALDVLTEKWRTQTDKQHELLSPDMIVPTVIQGGEWDVTIPEEVVISFGAMFTPSAVNVQQEIKEHIASVAATDPWTRANPPEVTFQDRWHYGAEISEAEPIVQLGLGALSDLGYDPKTVGCDSLTDAIHLINYAKIPTISIGPATQPAHMADEYVIIKELVDTTKIIALALLRWCGFL